jgi:hypothetical protein
MTSYSKARSSGLFSLNPFISGFWNSEQFEMVDVANFLCSCRLRDQDTVDRAESIDVTQTLTTFAGQQWRGKGARDIIGEML